MWSRSKRREQFVAHAARHPAQRARRLWTVWFSSPHPGNNPPVSNDDPGIVQPCRLSVLHRRCHLLYSDVPLDQGRLPLLSRASTALRYLPSGDSEEPGRKVSAAVSDGSATSEDTVGLFISDGLLVVTCIAFNTTVFYVSLVNELFSCFEDKA